MRTLSSTELKRLHRSWRRLTPGRVGLILDDVQNPYNVGAIIRTAAAFRIQDLWLAGSSATPEHEKARKIALGSERFVAYRSVDTIERAITEARADGYRIVGLELAESSIPIHQADLSDDTALVAGHEDRGLSSRCLVGCDEVIYIPQLGRVGSLNVAAALAIATYELRRRQWGEAH